MVTTAARNNPRRIPSSRCFSGFLSLHYRFIVSIFAAFELSTAIIIDMRKKMWVDELYTLLSAHQKSIGDIVKATVEGCDTAPPLYAIIVHFLLSFLPADQIAVRLPSTIGFTAMILFLAAFFRRVFAAHYALSGVSLTCLCAFEWACEGRPYGLALGFAACALYLWRLMAEDSRSAVLPFLFVISAAIMTALHFQALFFFGPLFAADVYRDCKGHRMRWKLWFATAAAILIVLLAHYDVLSGYGRFYRYCWAKAQWKYFPAILPLNITSKYVYESAAVLFAIAIMVHRRMFLRSAGSVLDNYMWAALLLYYLSPAAVFTISMFTTKVFISRYTVWMCMGAAGFATGLFALATKSSKRLGVLAAGILLAAAAVTTIKKASEKPFLTGTDEALEEIAHIPDDDIPIIAADHHIFMELFYYAPQKIRDRLIYPLSRELDIQYLGFDSGALLMDAIRKRYRMPIIDYSEILRRHNRFYVLSVSGHYLASLLEKEGCHLDLMKSDVYSALYLVTKR